MLALGAAPSGCRRVGPLGLGAAAGAQCWRARCGWSTDGCRRDGGFRRSSSTLAMLEIARGATYLVTESQTRYLGARVDAITTDWWPGCARPCCWPSRSSSSLNGRSRTRCSGADRRRRRQRRSRAPGRHRPASRSPIAFTLCGALAGLAAVTQAGRLAAADPNAGMGLELEAIAAVVIGGTSLTGGRGAIATSALGAW